LELVALQVVLLHPQQLHTKVVIQFLVQLHQQVVVAEAERTQQLTQEVQVDQEVEAIQLLLKDLVTLLHKLHHKEVMAELELILQLPLMLMVVVAVPQLQVAGIQDQIQGDVEQQQVLVVHLLL
tara:strand:+ start:118 stop:489 length:372 start_codon:yes stop_codon:yes gene_type:complete